MPLSFPQDGAFLRAISNFTDDALFWTDDGGRILAWSPGAERLFGWSEAEAVGRPVEMTVPADLRQQAEDLGQRVRDGEIVRDVVTVRQRADQTLIRVSLSLCPLQVSPGGTAGIIAIARDMSASERSDREARRLAAIVESSDDAIVSKDLNGIVMSWNGAAERIFGYTAADMIGTSIRVLIPDDRQREEDETLARIQAGLKVEHFETLRRRKDGRLIEISLTVSPIRNAAGHVIGASKIARDITGLKEAEVERLRLFHEHATVADQLNKVGAVVASGLEPEAIVQAVTDAGTELTGAEIGALFCRVSNSSGEPHTLSATSGLPPEAVAGFNPPSFEAAVTRTADAPAELGAHSPFAGLRSGQAVRSYLAVPITARSGEVLGGLFFGHAKPAWFSDRHERLAVGVASWAAVALENARLYVSAQEANRLKDHFLATLSHELRTPLNAILGYARMLQSGMVAPDKRGRAIQVIERNATSLTQIVEDVLDVSRIASGKMRLTTQPVDVSEVVRSAVDAVLPAADAKGIRVETLLERTDSLVAADPDRLRQVFWNLLSNAVKFTNTGGTVQVRLGRVSEHVEISVSDTGIGIAPAFLPHIFERFRQADAGTTRERGGLGLGLSIARQLVEMHGGTIDASSPGTGEGAIFRIVLPLLQLPENVSTRSAEATSSPGMVNAPLVNLKVLAVDDERDALLLLSEILETAGARVATASSAGAALQALDGEAPDVLVADLGMPFMDGFQLIERVRRHSDSRVRDMPAIALTAFARSEDRTKALDAGFHVHLAKPIDPSQLVTTVAMLGKHFDLPPDETNRPAPIR